MRKSLLLGAAYVALATAPAFAADLPARGPVKAPAMIPPVFSWTGCYVGVHVGGGFMANTDTDAAGVIGGGQLGCNYQFAPNFVLGIEGDFSGASIKDDQSLTVVGLGTGTQSFQVDWLASVTGRLGYSVDQLLFYVKGGVAFANASAGMSGTVVGIPFAGSLDETFTGWTVGGGIEWAFAPNWSTKIEYDYYDLGSKSFSVTGVGLPTAVFDFHPQIHVVKAGVNYRF
jgi:outer membrane immunogenic protein